VRRGIRQRGRRGTLKNISFDSIRENGSRFCACWYGGAITNRQSRTRTGDGKGEKKRRQDSRGVKKVAISDKELWRGVQSGWRIPGVAIATQSRAAIYAIGRGGEGNQKKTMPRISTWRKKRSRVESKYVLTAEESSFGVIGGVHPLGALGKIERREAGYSNPALHKSAASNALQKIRGGGGVCADNLQHLRGGLRP